MNKKAIILLLLLGTAVSSQAQLGKLKGMVGGKKDTAQASADTTKKSKAGGGQSLWSKAIVKVAKVAGSLGGSISGLVATTDNLDNVVPTASIMSNLHPTEVGVVGQSFVGGWQPGGTVAMLSFSASNAVQVYKINGSVTIDGQPANYAAMGVYTAYLKDNIKPKQVEITTASGQKASFTISPPRHTVKLLAINGQKNNPSIDLTKDVVLEVQNGPDGNNTPVLVTLTGTTLGLKTFYEVGWFKPSSKITIPAAMFRNMNGVTNNINFKDTYLQISRGSMEKASSLSGAFKDVDLANIVTDGMFINVTTKPVFNKGLAAEGKEKYSAGDVNYEVKKTHALFSPNFSSMKDLGVASFAIQGVTSFYDRKNDKLLDAVVTKSATFPQFSNEVWDKILDNMYQEVTSILKSEFAVNVVPLEKITNSAGYQSIAPYSKKDENSQDDFSRAYKNTKLLLGIRPISEMGGIKSGEYKIMKETGVNALLKFTIRLDINFEGSKAYMVPKMIFDINGALMGDVYNTSYVSGVITGDGVLYKKGITPDVLENVILRKSDMLATFKKSLQEIKAKESANGDYKIVYDAQVH